MKKNRLTALMIALVMVLLAGLPALAETVQIWKKLMYTISNFILQ